jgi:aspartate carbamoyltransferase catalytic subunit
VKLRDRNLLGIESLTPDEIKLILDTAVPFKEIFTRSVKKVPTLRGKTVVNLFYEPSTRTRFSFESAMQKLGGSVISTENAQYFSSAIKS